MGIIKAYDYKNFNSYIVLLLNCISIVKFLPALLLDNDSQ